MKKVFLALATVALLFATSCKKESINPAVDIPEGSFLATIDNGANPQNAPRINDGMTTKTTIDAQKYVIWENGDQISVNGSIYTTSKTGNSVVFSGGNATGSEFHAFYPASIAGTDAAGTLPATQTIELDGNNITVRNLPMYATSTNNQLTFHNICAVLKIEIPAFLNGATRIEVSTDKALHGTFTIGDNFAATVAAAQTDADRMLTVKKQNDIAFATNDTVYIAVPAMSYESLKVEFFNGATSMWTKTVGTQDEPINLSVNKIYNINATPNGLCFTYVEHRNHDCNNNCSIRIKKYGNPSSPITLDTCTYNALTQTYTNWGPYTVNTYIVLNNVGDKVYFRAGSSGNSTFSNASGYYYFDSTDTVEVSGNIMCLLSQTPSTTFPQGSTYTFYYLFMKMYKLRSAEKLVLPATTLVEGCYRELFSNCTTLVKAPELPATTLATSCYYNMFNMCKKLTTAPELPATDLEEKCYAYMFCECKSLTTAPELPATELKLSCYHCMFENCTTLVKAPELKATTLKKYCYYHMFKSCKSLTDVTMLATSIPAQQGCLEYWLQNAGTNAGTTPTLTVDSNTTTSSAWYSVINTETETNWAIKAKGASTNLRNAQ